MQPEPSVAEQQALQEAAGRGDEALSSAFTSAHRRFSPDTERSKHVLGALQQHFVRPVAVRYIEPAWKTGQRFR